MTASTDEKPRLSDDPELAIVTEPEIKNVPAPSGAVSSTSIRSASASRRQTTSTKSRTTREVGRKVGRKLKLKRKQQEKHSRIIKYGSLFLLVAQMVGLVLLMRYSRTTKGAKKSADGGTELYIASTAVFFMEVAKLTICVLVVFFQSGSTLTGLGSALYTHVWMSPHEVMKLCVPSVLYTIQNNLLYFALSHLDAATYQVCYQLKILTTAIFSAILLKRRFSAAKWFSLILLTIGIAIVQALGNAETVGNEALGQQQQKQNRFIGLVAVLCAACTSGFSGVYFEKILKGSQTSLWLRNIQMGLPSVLIAYTTIYVKDSQAVASHGFLFGYSFLVWTVVFVQAAGGLIVALVVKYADNVLKVFATAFSIIVSCLVSAFLFDFRPNFSFCIGTLLVMASTVIYARPEPRRKTKTILPMTATTKKEMGKKRLVT